MPGRRIIVALQVSLDGLIEGPNGEVDWIANWDDPFEVLPEIDTCVLGGGMYPGYEEYWLAILADPDAVLELTGRKPSPEEVAYARFRGAHAPRGPLEKDQRGAPEVGAHRP